jgi:superfamily II RNA helicase
MVKITDDNTEFSSDSKYNSYFESFPYPLSNFQKHAIAAIVDGDHALVCAPTGSGKTLPAEFAIRHFTGLGKRVIYCSPIKALSNQKLFDFTHKYPDITFGLLTGDIKTNPSAQVLIMTTEILMNRLFTMTADQTSKSGASSLSFEMDIENELGAVVFDELHYINDQHRGHVWEQSILMLPKHVQMVMLSATLDDPVKFARWCEGNDHEGNDYEGNDYEGNVKEGLDQGPFGADIDGLDNIPDTAPQKQVVICATNHRVVPLTHYVFMCSTEGLFKKINNKEVEEKTRTSLNKCLPIKAATGEFIEKTYFETRTVMNMLSDNNVMSHRKFVLNELFTHLKSNDMLPAIVFIFSRRLVEQCAEEITVPLYNSELEDYNPFTVRRECETVLRKLPNWREYVDLPEYQKLVSLLEKGIGIHHSGMIPVLREIVELMISKKYIKVLFATESFAIGLDCPIKTAVFISLKKFDGSSQRYLMPHEYTQMAGRAGRRGLDKVGHVIHCANLFVQPEIANYKEILCGKPQKLVSKFQIYYPMLLNVLHLCTIKTPTLSAVMSEQGVADCAFQMRNGVKNDRVKNDRVKHYKDGVGDKDRVGDQEKTIHDFVDFANKSMMKSELIAAERGLYNEIETNDNRIRVKSDVLDHLKTPRETLVEYDKILKTLEYATNKRRKEADDAIRKMKAAYNQVERDYPYYLEYKQLVELKKQKESQLAGTQQYIQSSIEALLTVMEETDIVKQDEPGHYSLTSEKGIIASNVAEIHPVLISLLCSNWNYFEYFTVPQLAAFFSIFTDIRVPEDIRFTVVNCCYDDFLNGRIHEFEHFREMIIAKEEKLRIYGSSGLDDFCYDIMDDVLEWCGCENENQCRQLIMFIYQEKGISVGDFTKALMKISTISRELQGLCEVMNKTEFMHKLAAIDRTVLKYVATSQSLYL